MSSGVLATVPSFAQRPAGPSEPPLDVYANQLRAGATLHDFTLIFGVTEDIGANQVINRDKVTVRLSPGMAKTLALQLIAIVEAYEKGVGPIPTSDRNPAEIAALKASMIRNYQEQMAKPA
jgi:hypothetical protein